ncbi:excisionase family DNA binding protein [Desulfobaculum xiamenense]|uniref:Excisionase family DNA binding protein n=1 Tax=Desulfobaculum xiamenense TaxID=995050 RepID=A0A846QDI7_9BACT|nr:helix-turn-helix transcriptional regulator [Desulfobaculum xiamenense]NJB66371.1 excisionase family DNA binding protein [Desulfobaculum xiamenense]
MKRLLSTREVAQFLGVNEKMIYTLISEKGLPASKVTGKWLFPSHLVEQWVEGRTINYPSTAQPGSLDGLLVVAGSNDILLDKALGLYMRHFPDELAVFGNMGSLGGIKALKRGTCHMAASHLAEEEREEYNFSYAAEELKELPAVVNFCRREQILYLAPGNPLGITTVADIPERGLKVANRPLGTGTRLLFDRLLSQVEADTSKIPGYEREFPRHMDVGLEVLAGRADCGPGIRAVAGLLGLDTLHVGWERFDLLIPKDRFFEKPVQQFLNMLTDPEFKALSASLDGYDLSESGKMVFPGG